METSAMSQQRLQLIHIGQSVPRSPCMPTVVTAILRGIRSSCPHEDTGVTSHGQYISTETENCVENHLSNKGLLEGIHHDRHPPSTPRSFNTQKTDKTWLALPWTHIQSYTTLSTKASTDPDESDQCPCVQICD